MDWRNVRVASSSDGGSTWTQYTPSQAETAGLTAKVFNRWNGNTYDPYDNTTSGKIGALQPQESVWVQIKSGAAGLSGFKLLIPKRELNDTGITWSGNYTSGNNTAAGCIANDADGANDNVVTAQDCSNGPDDADMTGNTDADGHAGFSYTKLDSNGDPLPNQTVTYATTPWACVQDNVTGLIWEVKTDDGGLHDKDDTYTWYNTDTASNGGAVGEENPTGNTCSGWSSGASATYCNTQEYVNRVNILGICGFTDWRMPTLKELESLANFGRSNPAIDTGYFPNAVGSFVWSGSPFALYSANAWCVDFYDGFSYANNRLNAYAVRLVRGGQ